MKNIKNLINFLNEKGILIWEKGGKIAYKSPVGAMNEELKNEILNNRDELVEYLKEKSRIKRMKIINNDALVEITPLSNREENFVAIKENIKNEVEKLELEYVDLINDSNLSKWVENANDVSLRDMFKTFYNGGIFRDNKYYSLDDIIDMLEIDSDYEHFIAKWLKVLVERKIILENDEGYKFIDYSYIEKINEDYWKNFAKIEETINYGQDFFDYMNKCSRSLLDILQKKIKTVDILFPEGAENSAIGLYSDNKGSRLFNKLVGNVVHKYIQTHEKKSIKILEIGAGIGGTTRSIMDKIKNEKFEYYYTDISYYFLNKAMEKYGTQNVHYKIYDINDSIYKQGFGDEKFDVILCANMLHNSKNGYEVLRNINHILNDKGIFVIIDETTEPEFLLTSIELNDALSSFYDDRAKNNGVFFTYEQWETMFKTCKANIWVDFPQKDSDLALTGQRLFIGNFSESYCIDSEIVKDVIDDDCIDKIVIVDNIDKEDSMDTVSIKNHEEVNKKTLLQMIKIWEEILQSDNIKSTDSFFDVGGDSLVITQLITKIWNVYPKTKQLKWKEFSEIIFKHPILKDLALFIDNFNNSEIQNKIEEVDNMIELSKCNNPRRIYILFHDGTGELNVYNNFIRALNEKEGNVSIYGFRIDNIRKFNNKSFYRDLANEYSDSILSKFNENEIVLVGHCVGGLLALETGNILSKKDINISEVILISSFLNEGKILFGNNILKKYLDSDFLMGIIFREVIGDRQSDNHIYWSDIENAVKYMEINGFNSIENSIRETQYINKNLYNMLMDYEGGNLIPPQYAKQFDIFKKHFLAASEYEPSPYEGVLKFVHGNLRTDNFFMEGEGLFNDAENLWKKLVTTNIIYYTIDADHFTVMDKENCNKIIENLLQKMR